MCPEISPEHRATALQIGVEAGLAASAASLGTDQVAAILGAASVPIFARLSQGVIERRANTFGARLLEAGVTPKAFLEAATHDPELLDVFQIGVTAALQSGIEAKRALLARVVAERALGSEERDEGFSRRVVSCLSRVDVAEVHVLRVISEASGGRVAHDRISVGIGAGMADTADSVLAVLVSEGLVSGTAEAGWSTTGFGQRIIRELIEESLPQEP